VYSTDQLMSTVQPNMNRNRICIIDWLIVSVFAVMCIVCLYTYLSMCVVFVSVCVVCKCVYVCGLCVYVCGLSVCVVFVSVCVVCKCVYVCGL